MTFQRSPKIYTFEAIVAQLAEVFAGLATATYLKPHNKELFESLADKEFLEDWLINSLDENMDEIIEGFRNSVDDEVEDNKIQEYLKMMNELRIETDLFAIVFVHSDSDEDYMREKYKDNTDIQNIQNHIDWEGLADEEFEDWDAIGLNYPAIGFTGTWNFR